MTASETFKTASLEDIDSTIPFHCPKCGTSQKFLTLEALNSHVETAHICRLSSLDRRSEEGQVDSSPILSLFTKESKRLETELQNQLKDTKETRKCESSDQPTTSSGIEGSLTVTSSSTMAHLLQVAPPPAGLYCCTSDFALARKGLSKSNEHLRFSSGALLCPYDVKPRSQIPHVLTSYLSEALVQQAPTQPQTAPAVQQELLRKQKKAYEVEKQTLTEELHKVRNELDALRSRAADVVESQQRQIDSLSEQVNLKDMQVESTREVLGRSTEDKRTAQHALSVATEQNIAHLETITQLQNMLCEKGKMLESKSEELNNLTAFLKSSAEKETFAREKLEEMLSGLLTQKEGLEIKILEMNKEIDMYKCILGNVAGVPIEFPGSNIVLPDDIRMDVIVPECTLRKGTSGYICTFRPGGDAARLPVPNHARVSCGPEGSWLLSSPGQLPQQPMRLLTVAPQVGVDGDGVDGDGVQRDYVEETLSGQWQAVPESHERRQDPKRQDTSGDIQSDWPRVSSTSNFTDHRHPQPGPNLSRSHSPNAPSSAFHRVSFRSDQVPDNGHSKGNVQASRPSTLADVGLPFIPHGTDRMSRDHPSGDQLYSRPVSYQELQQEVLHLQQQLLTANEQLRRRQLQNPVSRRMSSDDDDPSEMSTLVESSSSSLSSSVVTIVDCPQASLSTGRQNRQEPARCQTKIPVPGKYQKKVPEHVRFHQVPEPRPVRYPMKVPQVAMTTAKRSPKRLSHVSMSERQQQCRDALFCVFMYLDTVTLSRVARVSRLWRDMSRHPTLWRSVMLKGMTLSSQHLCNISRWCSELRSLTLQGLRPRARRGGEMDDEYAANIRGSLEPGVEALFRAAGEKLLSLKIVHCDNVITARCMWLVSCMCLHLQRVAYTSEVDPVSSEAVWALGAGCRYISTFIVPPCKRHICCVEGLVEQQQMLGLNNRGLLMIGRCWPQLRVLCVGGADVSVKGLVAVARRCRHLEVLELCEAAEVNRHTARHMCNVGLTCLESLDFTHTPVTPDAIRHFSDCCQRLQTITVTIDLIHYCSGQQSDQTRSMHILEALKEMEICQSLQCELRVKIHKSSAYDRLTG